MIHDKRRPSKNAAAYILSWMLLIAFFLMAGSSLVDILEERVWPPASRGRVVENVWRV
jgi:hypothetical protein